MVTFEECAQMLDEIADSMPQELFRDLNAGMSLADNLTLPTNISLSVSVGGGVSLSQF